MTELSLNILDIAQNSIKAKASVVGISVQKDTVGKTLTVSIKDNGCGMTAEQTLKVTDPFYTTRTTRKVGLGIPFFKMSAEMTGGYFKIDSEVGVGTFVKAVYHYNHIDMTPIGDVAATMMSLISVNPDIDFTYDYGVDQNIFHFSTVEIKKQLDGVPINSGDVLIFIRDYISENQEEVDKALKIE